MKRKLSFFAGMFTFSILLISCSPKISLARIDKGPGDYYYLWAGMATQNQYFRAQTPGGLVCKFQKEELTCDRLLKVKLNHRAFKKDGYFPSTQ